MTKVAILLLVFSLTSCVVIPVEETVSVLVSGLSELSASSPEEDAPCALRYSLRSVCIEYNQDVAVPDFVPAIQNKFKKLRVESAVYAPGSMPTSCEATLRYTASRDWKNRFPRSGGLRNLFSSGEMQPYLVEAQLILLEDNRVIASSRYQAGDSSHDKWTTTAYKMNPVINDLVCKKTEPGTKNDSIAE